MPRRAETDLVYHDNDKVGIRAEGKGELPQQGRLPDAGSPYEKEGHLAGISNGLGEGRRRCRGGASPGGKGAACEGPPPGLGEAKAPPPSEGPPGLEEGVPDVKVNGL